MDPSSIVLNEITAEDETCSLPTPTATTFTDKAEFSQFLEQVVAVQKKKCEMEAKGIKVTSPKKPRNRGKTPKADLPRSKPTVSYAKNAYRAQVPYLVIAGLALRNAHGKSLTSRDIYQYHFPGCLPGTHWKNSIRHILCTQGCFVNGGVASPKENLSFMWGLDPSKTGTIDAAIAELELSIPDSRRYGMRDPTLWDGLREGTVGLPPSDVEIDLGGQKRRRQKAAPKEEEEEEKPPLFYRITPDGQRVPPSPSPSTNSSSGSPSPPPNQVVPQVPPSQQFPINQPMNQQFPVNHPTNQQFPFNQPTNQQFLVNHPANQQILFNQRFYGHYPPMISMRQQYQQQYFAQQQHYANMHYRQQQQQNPPAPQHSNFELDDDMKRMIHMYLVEPFKANEEEKVLNDLDLDMSPEQLEAFLNDGSFLGNILEEEREDVNFVML